MIEIGGRRKGDGVSRGRAFPKRCANFGNEMGDAEWSEAAEAKPASRPLTSAAAISLSCPPSRPLVPKVSEALWERTCEAKLRFGGGRVSMGTAIEVVARQNGDGVSPG